MYMYMHCFRKYKICLGSFVVHVQYNYGRQSISLPVLEYESCILNIKKLSYRPTTRCTCIYIV